MNKIKITLLFFFQFTGVILYGQEDRLFEELRKKVQIDSYYDSVSVFRSGERAMALAKKNGSKSQEAEILILYGNHFYYNQQFDRAKEYYSKAYKIASSGGEKSLERLAKIRLTYILEEEGKRDLVEAAFKEILEESVDAHDYRNIVESYNALGITKERENKMNEALQFYLEGLRVAEKNSMDYYTAVLLNNIGLIKLNSGETENALADFERGLVIANREGNPRLAGHLQNNIGLVYLSLKKNDEGLRHYRATLNYARVINHPKELAISYINLGSALMQSDMNREAMVYYDSAIYVLEKNNMRFELTKAILGKSDLMIKNKAFSEAEILLNRAIDLCTTTSNLEDHAFAHMMLHKVYEGFGKHQEALKEYKTYRDLSDSLNDLRNKAQMNKLHVQYDVEMKENQLEQEKNRSLILEQENHLKKVRIRIIISIAVGLLFVLGLFFYIRYMRTMRIQQEKFSHLLIENIEDERSRIARDLHDDIGQSLSVIKSKINLRNRDKADKKDELEDDIGKIIEQTREISRSLYPSFLEKIGFVRSVARLMEIIQNSTTIECSFEIDEEVDSISPDKKTHLYRIVQECVNNTVKHSGATALKISIELQADTFIFTYRDNGKGITGPVDNKGLGFLSMKERSKMLNGEMQVSDNAGKGFKLMIKFIRE